MGPFFFFLDFPIVVVFRGWGGGGFFSLLLLSSALNISVWLHLFGHWLTLHLQFTLFYVSIISFPHCSWLCVGTMIPVQRLGKTVDIAYATVFLCLAESGFITGELLWFTTTRRKRRWRWKEYIFSCFSFIFENCRRAAAGVWFCF